ncbi:HAMP domain-containing histidine kinase [Pendulispora rubella]|uniref:histidine kinase n=1 Tax=Pendulispora rubella TaxID=2741070 RepID=A0ABZ2LCC1_9BACT
MRRRRRPPSREAIQRWHRHWHKFDPRYFGLRHPFHRVKFQFLLQRRIFLWFGLTILASGLFVGVSTRFFTSGQGWSADVDHARTFLARRYAEVWNDADQRSRLARATAHDLNMNLVVRDASGHVLQSIGAQCKKSFDVPIVSDEGEALGKVTLCVEHHAFGKSVLIPLCVGLLVVWAASGLIARRVARPIYQVALVADDIGRGHFSSRTRLPMHDRGEMGLLAEVLNDMTERIEKQLADQRALLATVSHEIRTPLARMRLLIELGRSAVEQTAEGDGKPCPALDELDREVVAIDALVSDLLAGSRIDFAATKPVTMDATEVAKEAIERTGVAPEKLAVDVPHLEFRGDPTLVARAVHNLLENAERHAGGVAMFHVHRDGNFVAFDVEDDGPGFTPGEASQAFEPFYKNPRNQAASARSSGLGLALVKRIAEAHGGRAFAENRAQGGARVGVRFKLVGR